MHRQDKTARGHQRASPQRCAGQQCQALHKTGPRQGVRGSTGSAEHVSNCSLLPAVKITGSLLLNRHRDAHKTHGTYRSYQCLGKKRSHGEEESFIWESSMLVTSLAKSHLQEAHRPTAWEFDPGDAEVLAHLTWYPCS